MTSIPHSDDLNLADRLRRLRTSTGLSYQLLADRSYVDVKYLHELETGQKAHPSRDVIIRIGIGLGLELVEIDELLIQQGHLPLISHRKAASVKTADQARRLEESPA